VNEEVNRDKTGEADEMNLEVDYVDELMRIFFAHQPLMMAKNGDKERVVRGG